MVNAISGSGISQGSQVRALTPVTQEQLYSPGQYARDMQEIMGIPQPREEKKGTFLGFIGKLILAGAVVGGTAIAARKFVTPLKGEIAELTDKSSFKDKAVHYFQKYTDKLSEQLGKVKNVFSKTEGKEIEPKVDGSQSPAPATPANATEEAGTILKEGEITSLLNR